MRVSLNKRLGKLEEAIPSKAEVEAHEAAWREAFKEFGVPSDTPVPNHMPIIRQLIEVDGKPSKKLLRLNGRFVGRQRSPHGKVMTAKQSSYPLSTQLKDGQVGGKKGSTSNLMWYVMWYDNNHTQD